VRISVVRLSQNAVTPSATGAPTVVPLEKLTALPHTRLSAG